MEMVGYLWRNVDGERNHMSVPNTQNSVMGVTVRGANARRIVNSTASAGRTVAPPALFQVRVYPDGEGTVAVDVWLVPDIAEAVRRNGWPVEPQGAYVVAEPRWLSIASGIAVSDTPKYVVLRCKWDSPTWSKPSGWTGDLYWTIGIETSTAAAAIDRFETPVVLGVIVGWRRRTWARRRRGVPPIGGDLPPTDHSAGAAICSTDPVGHFQAVRVARWSRSPPSISAVYRQYQT